MGATLDLTNMRDTEPSIRFDRIASDGGELRLRPAVRWPDSDRWNSHSTVSLWTTDDIARAAAWFARNADPDEPVSEQGVWFAVPAVGFRVISRDGTALALDVCWTHASDVPRPTLTGQEAVSTGDDRYTYMTMDMLHATVQGVAATWSAWAAESSQPSGHDAP